MTPKGYGYFMLVLRTNSLKTNSPPRPLKAIQTLQQSGFRFQTYCHTSLWCELGQFIELWIVLPMSDKLNPICKIIISLVLRSQRCKYCICCGVHTKVQGSYVGWKQNYNYTALCWSFWGCFSKLQSWLILVNCTNLTDIIIDIIMILLKEVRVKFSLSIKDHYLINHMVNTLLIAKSVVLALMSHWHSTTILIVGLYLIALDCVTVQNLNTFHTFHIRYEGEQCKC